MPSALKNIIKRRNKQFECLRIKAVLLGIEDDEWRQIYTHAKKLSVNVTHYFELIEIALRAKESNKV